MDGEHSRRGQFRFHPVCRENVIRYLLSFFIIQTRDYTRDGNVTFRWPMLVNRRGASIIGCGGGSSVDLMLISGTGLALYVFLLEDLRAREAATRSLAANPRGEEFLGQLSLPSSARRPRQSSPLHP